jgi:very-short-patch-repair endonuclease
LDKTIFGAKETRSVLDTRRGGDLVIGLQLLEKLGFYQPADYNHIRFECLAPLCESPVEAAFWSAAYFELSKLGRLTPQIEVGPYRLDFGLETETFKLAIEIDGHDFHSTKEQKATDYQRDRYLQSQGWRVIRFSGSEVYQDASKCALEAVKIARGIK